MKVECSWNIHHPYQPRTAHGASLRVVISFFLTIALPIYGFWLLEGILIKEGPAVGQFFVSRGRIESVVANHFGEGMGNVKKVSLDEPVGGQRHPLFFGSIGVFVGEGHCIIGKRADSSIRYGSSSYVPGKIEQYALTVMARSDVNAPVFFIERASEALPLSRGHPWGQSYHSLYYGLMDIIEKFSPEHPHDCFDG